MNNSKRNLELDNFIAEWTLIFIRVNNTGTKLFPMGQIFKYFKKKKVILLILGPGCIYTLILASKKHMAEFKCAKIYSVNISIFIDICLERFCDCCIFSKCDEVPWLYEEKSIHFFVNLNKNLDKNSHKFIITH